MTPSSGVDWLFLITVALRLGLGSTLHTLMIAQPQALNELSRNERRSVAFMAVL